MGFIRLIPVIAFIAYCYYTYKNTENEEERKKVRRNIITIVGVWIGVLLLLSIPMIFIILAGKIQGH